MKGNREPTSESVAGMGNSRVAERDVQDVWAGASVVKLIGRQSPAASHCRNSRRVLFPATGKRSDAERGICSATALCLSDVMIVRSDNSGLVGRREGPATGKRRPDQKTDNARRQRFQAIQNKELVRCQIG